MYMTTAVLCISRRHGCAVCADNKSRQVLSQVIASIRHCSQQSTSLLRQTHVFRQENTMLLLCTFSVYVFCCNTLIVKKRSNGPVGLNLGKTCQRAGAVPEMLPWGTKRHWAGVLHQSHKVLKVGVLFQDKFREKKQLFYP